jgi:hydrogenase-4 component E
VISLLIAFVIVLLLPLFMANWRVSLSGLAIQGFLLFFLASRSRGVELSVEGALTTLDLLVLRGIVAPSLLWKVLSDRNTPERNDMLPPNLLAWAGALGLLLLGFRVGDALVPIEGEMQMLVGVAACAALLGFLVLATQVGPLSQMVGVLRIENAIALFEVGATHESSPGLRLALIVTYATSVALLRWYLAGLQPPAEPETAE